MKIVATIRNQPGVKIDLLSDGKCFALQQVGPTLTTIGLSRLELIALLRAALQELHVQPQRIDAALPCGETVQ